MDPSTPLPRPLSPASGPSGCPAQPSCLDLPPPEALHLHPGLTLRTPELQPMCTTALYWLRPAVSSAPPARLPPHQPRSPLLCLCTGCSQHVEGLAASPTWSLLQVLGRDHFCDTLAHWLWQIWEPAGLSCLIHAPPLSPATSNSHLPPAAASGNQRG